MIIKTLKKDIITDFKEGRIDLMVHGCNCFHTMGAGIAYQIAKAFPETIKADNTSKYGHVLKLGTYTKALVRIDKTQQEILNVYTQYYPGRNFEYFAFIKFLKKLNKDYKKKGVLMGFPKIGCGIGGGDWDLINSLIEKYTPDLKIIIYDYRP